MIMQPKGYCSPRLVLGSVECPLEHAAGEVVISWVMRDIARRSGQRRSSSSEKGPW